LIIFLAALAAVIFLAIWPAGQNQPGKVYKVGLLQMASTVNANMDGFKEGMAEFGYKEGQNIIYDYFNAEGRPELLAENAKRFVDGKVDLIFTNTSPAAQAAKDATKDSNVPVVFSMVADPIRAGFVASVKSSGNNLSGTSCAYIDIAPKRLEALKELKPSIKKVLVFYRPGDKSGEPAAQELEKAAKKLGLEILARPVSKKEEITQALNKLKPGEVDAIMDPADSMVTSAVDDLVSASLRLKIPLMMLSDLEAEKGALITYGVDYFDLGKQSARLAARILEGASPTDIPFETPRMFRIVVNEKTANAIGLNLPDSILAKASRLIKK